MSINIFLGFGIVWVLSTFGSTDGWAVTTRRKIVGGSNASPCEDPHIVALQIIYNGTYFMCGGSILDETHIITAAHCLNYSEKVIVLAGSTNRMAMPTEIEVESYELHPGYDLNGETGNDVSVLKLTKPIKFTECIKPIDLAADNDTKYKNCVIAGWGLKNATNKVTEANLQRAEVKLTEEDLCLKFIPAEEKDQIICAGDNMDNGVGGCYGDSGGPLACEHPLTGRTTLVGVTSYGPTNCDKGITIFSRMAYYKTWIESKMDS